MSTRVNNTFLWKRCFYYARIFIKSRNFLLIKFILRICQKGAWFLFLLEELSTRWGPKKILKPELLLIQRRLSPYCPPLNTPLIVFIESLQCITTREQGIEGRYNWRGSTYHMIIHALQTVLHLHNKYLSDDKYHDLFRTDYCIHWTMKKL